MVRSKKIIVAIILGAVLLSLPSFIYGESNEAVRVCLNALVLENGEDIARYDGSVQLLDSNGNVLQEIKQNEGALAFDDLVFTEIGTYTYRLRQKAGNSKNIDYDDSEYGIEIDVYLSNDGTTLETSVTYTKNGSIYNGEIVFENINGGETDPVTYFNVKINWQGDRKEDRPTEIEIGSFLKGDMMNSCHIRNADNWMGKIAYYEDEEHWSIKPVKVPLGYTWTLEKKEDTYIITFTKKEESKGDVFTSPETGDENSILILSSVFLLSLLCLKTFRKCNK